MVIKEKRYLTFSIYLNGYSFTLQFQAFDPVRMMQYVYGFEIRKNNQPWRWAKIYKGDYGLMYTEGRRGKEVVGWRLRGPFEFIAIT